MVLSWHNGKASLLAVSALIIGLSLQGCLPGEVVAACKEEFSMLTASLEVTLQDEVYAACDHNYAQPTTRNGCIGQRFKTISRAEDKVIGGFADRCGNYVKNVACTFGTPWEQQACHKDLSKATQGQIADAIRQYVTSNGDAIKQRLQRDVRAAIRNIVEADYNAQYSKRAVPYVLNDMCEVRVNRATPWSVLDTIALPENVLYSQKEELQKACGKKVLDKLCPKHSPCGIETNKAPLYSAGSLIDQYVGANIGPFLEHLRRCSDNYPTTGRCGSFTPSGLWDATFKMIQKGASTPGILATGAVLMVLALGVSMWTRRVMASRAAMRAEQPASELLVCEDSALPEIE